MKIFTKDGVVQATAESMEDIAILLSFTQVKKVRKVHKRHAFSKQCDICGRTCKGLVGLRVHQAKCKKMMKLKEQEVNVTI